MEYGGATITDGRFDAASGDLTLELEDETGSLWTIRAQVKGEKVTGTAIFHRTIQSTGVTYLHRQTFAARRIADGTGSRLPASKAVRALPGRLPRCVGSPSASLS